MRLFGYYALHTFKNQLKKLFKTWVLIFIVACMLIGFIIGFGASMIEDLATFATSDEPQEEEIIETVPEEEEIQINTEELYAVTELIVGGIIALVLVFELIGADKNGSKIFLPADVNLLFPSPLKPQSVLLFRLTTQLGVVLISSIYLCFQIPNLVVNIGLGIFAAIGILFAWLLTVAIGKLIQILVYTVCSTYTQLKRHIRTATYASVAVIAVSFLLYAQFSGLGYYTAAKSFFNAQITRFIPVWGWIKAICIFSIEQNFVGVLIYTIATLIFGVLLCVVIWKIRADFYEDAMAKTQETAEIMESAQTQGFAKRKKDRSEKLKRDGLTRGSGANIFFFRSMYNRFRFAHFGIFTKTAETYLIVALGVSALCRFVFETDSVLPVVLTIAALAFFRTLGNPLAEDTSKDFFRLIPEPSFTKLLYSVLGGSANCLMDIIPALVIACIFLGANPLYMLAWIPFILSVDFYGTNTGAFIDLSLQVNAGKMIKQLVQILFIYFGLLPDVAIIAISIILGFAPIGAIIAAAINLGIGFLFLVLAPLFIDYKDKGKQ